MSATLIWANRKLFSGYNLDNMPLVALLTKNPLIHIVSFKSSSNLVFVIMTSALQLLTYYR